MNLDKLKAALKAGGSAALKAFVAGFFAAMGLGAVNPSMLDSLLHLLGLK